MPSPNATRFELAVYVEPHHAAAARALIEDGSDSSLLLDMEKLVGARLDDQSVVLGTAPYGVGVVEVYCEGET